MHRDSALSDGAHAVLPEIPAGRSSSSAVTGSSRTSSSTAATDLDSTTQGHTGRAKPVTGLSPRHERVESRHGSQESKHGRHESRHGSVGSSVSVGLGTSHTSRDFVSSLGQVSSCGLLQPLDDGIGTMGETVGGTLFQLAEQVSLVQRAFQEKLNDVKRAKQTAEAVVVQLQGELATMQAKHATQTETDRLHAQTVKDLQGQIVHLTRKIEALLKQLSVQQAALADAAQAEGARAEEACKVQETADAQQLQIGRLGKKHDAAQAKLKAAQVNAQALEAQYNASQQQIDTLTSKSKEGDTEVKALKRQHQQAMAKERAKFEKELTQLREGSEATIKELKASSMALSGEKLKVELQMKSLRKKNSEESGQTRGELTDLLQLNSQASQSPSLT